jgi:hypothetical protein
MRSKLNALLLGVLCASSLLLGCQGSRDPQKIPVVVDSSPIAGIVVIAPGDARFDQEARQPGRACAISGRYSSRGCSTAHAKITVKDL